MRVISQDGAVDVPYETGSFNMICAELVEPKRTNIYCHHSSIGVAIKIAEYSTEAKAIKAMEMLREAYTGKPKLNVNEIPNLTPQEFGEKLGISDILLCDKTNADVSFSSNYYFQFPQDDEIEV